MRCHGRVTLEEGAGGRKGRGRRRGIKTMRSRKMLNNVANERKHSLSSQDIDKNLLLTFHRRHPSLAARSRHVCRPSASASSPSSSFHSIMDVGWEKGGGEGMGPGKSHW